MLLESCDTGADLTVTYQRPPQLSPSYLEGPPFSPLQQAANMGQCMAHYTQTVSHTKLHTGLTDCRLVWARGQKSGRVFSIRGRLFKGKCTDIVRSVYGCLFFGWGRGAVLAVGKRELAGM